MWVFWNTIKYYKVTETLGRFTRSSSNGIVIPTKGLAAPKDAAAEPANAAGSDSGFSRLTHAAEFYASQAATQAAGLFSYKKTGDEKSQERNPEDCSQNFATLFPSNSILFPSYSQFGGFEHAKNPFLFPSQVNKDFQTLGDFSSELNAKHTLW